MINNLSLVLHDPLIHLSLVDVSPRRKAVLIPMIQATPHVSACCSHPQPGWLVLNRPPLVSLERVVVFFLPDQVFGRQRMVRATVIHERSGCLHALTRSLASGTSHAKELLRFLEVMGKRSVKLGCCGPSVASETHSRVFVVRQMGGFFGFGRDPVVGHEGVGTRGDTST